MARVSSKPPQARQQALFGRGHSGDHDFPEMRPFFVSQVWKRLGIRRSKLFCFLPLRRLNFLFQVCSGEKPRPRRSLRPAKREAQECQRRPSSTSNHLHAKGAKPMTWLHFYHGGGGAPETAESKVGGDFEEREGTLFLPNKKTDILVTLPPFVAESGPGRRKDCESTVSNNW